MLDVFGSISRLCVSWVPYYFIWLENIPNVLSPHGSGCLAVLGGSESAASRAINLSGLSRYR